MDKASQDHLDEITSKEPAALTEAEVAFLRARRGYLTPAQEIEYAEVLEVSEPEAQVEAEETASDEGQPEQPEAPAKPKSNKKK